MAKQAIAGLVVVGLAIGVWTLWPREGPAQSTTTTVLAGGTTTAIPEATSTTMASTTTTTLATGNHVVETVEEAEEILRELWFGWFEGIYNQDEDRIREVVVTEELFEDALSLFATAEFTSAPTPSGIDIQSIEILRSDEQCLSVWVEADASSFRGEGSSGVAVYILRSTSDGWRMATSWVSPDDLWEADCDAQLESFS